MSEDFPFERFLNFNDKNNNKNNILQEILSDKDPLELSNNAESKTEDQRQETQRVTNRNFNNESADEETFSEISMMNNEILNYLQENIPQSKYKTFFEDTFALKEINGDTILFSVTTPFIKNIINGHYLNVVKDAIEIILGKEYEVEIVCIKSNQSLSSNKSSILNSISKSETYEDEIQKVEKSAPKSVKEAKFSIDILKETNNDLRNKAESQYLNHVNAPSNTIAIDKSKTFDNFVVGPSNNLAYATARAVADTPGKNGKYPSLYIYSNSGLGKTHLLHAVANGINEKYPLMRICLITAREFMKEMIDAIRNKNIGEFQNKFTEKIDVLMIDDIHELKNKEGTQNEFFHIFNELHAKGKQLIFTSDKSPQEIDGIEERIKTRLQWGLVLDIQKPDLETRIAILRKKAYELDLFLQDDVINLIATSFKSSIRELEGSLIRLSAYAEVMNVEIDTELTKDLLGLDNFSEDKKITLDHIAKATSQFYKIPLVDLKSKARGKEIALARHIAMYLSRKLIHATQKDIGRYFGNRDHTSVIHGVNKIQELLKTDTNISKDVFHIENSIQ